MPAPSARSSSSAWAQCRSAAPSGCRGAPKWRRPGRVPCPTSPCSSYPPCSLALPLRATTCGSLARCPAGFMPRQAWLGWGSQISEAASLVFVPWPSGAAGPCAEYRSGGAACVRISTRPGYVDGLLRHRRARWSRLMDAQGVRDVARTGHARRCPRCGGGYGTACVDSDRAASSCCPIPTRRSTGRSSNSANLRSWSARSGGSKATPSTISPPAAVAHSGAFFLGPSGARADVIDGDRCAADGRTLPIEGRDPELDGAVPSCAAPAPPRRAQISSCSPARPPGPAGSRSRPWPTGWSPPAA